MIRLTVNCGVARLRHMAKAVWQRSLVIQGGPADGRDHSV
jgi:hypothetical protein